MARFYGDPKVECLECHCNPEGSKTLQCDMKSGKCHCLPGIGGDKCDTCARGYLGTAPKCYPCGECFDNWDRILDEIKNNTLALIKRAGEIKKVGARGAYTKEFDDMQNQLDQIEQLLSSSEEVNINQINEDLKKLALEINGTEQEDLKDLDATLANTKENVFTNEIKINNLRTGIDSLNEKIKELENNGTQLQEDNVQGALTLIQNAKRKADEAAHKAEYTEKTIGETERVCKAVENLLNSNKESYEQSIKSNTAKLEKIANDTSKLSRLLPELNDLVCDGHGDPCDSICGGAGCSSCGTSISCENGAKQLAETALSLANSTEIALRNKEGMANDFIRNVSQIDTNESKKIALATYKEAENLFNNYNSTIFDVDDLKKNITSFLESNNTQPETIIKLGEEILKRNINITAPDLIKQLADEIKKKVDSLTNTEAIIDATKDNLTAVNRLKENAAEARNKAANLSTDANEIKEALEISTKAQEDAEKAINLALNHTASVNELLTKIKEKTSSAQEKTNATAKRIENLENKLNNLQHNITNNVIYANRVKNETSSILQNAKKAYEYFDSLNSDYETAKNKLAGNINNVRSLKERANDLFKKVVALLAQINTTDDEIKKLKTSKNSLQDPKAMENKLQLLIKRADDSTRKIESQINYYKGCQN